MPDKPERRYWDSDCFIGWLAEEAGKVDPCRQVLSLAETGEIEIVTSALTIAEVLHMRNHSAIPKDKRDTIRQFFHKSYIIVVPILRATAERGQDLVWDHGIKPKDALHVATAIDVGVSLFNTFDEELIKKGNELNAYVLVFENPRADQMVLPYPG